MSSVELPVAETRSSAKSNAETKAGNLIFHLAWLLPCLIIWVWFFASRFDGLVLPEAMEAAQAGRQVSEGQGFTTKVLRPLGLVRVGNLSHHPDLYNAPLYPLLLGISFNLSKPDDRTAGLVSAALGFLTVLLTYALGARLFNRRAAALAAVLVALHLGLLRAGLSGLNVTLLAGLVTLGFLCVVGHRGTLSWSLLCGAVCGLAYLADYDALVLAIPVLGLLVYSQRSRRARHASMFLVGLAIVMLPWLARNWAVGGNPLAGLRSYAVATQTASYPQMSIYRVTDSQVGGSLAFVARHKRESVKKLLLNLGSFQAALPATLGLCLVALVGLALFVEVGGQAGNRAKWALVGGLALLGVKLAAGQPRYELLCALVGVAAAVGAAAFMAEMQARRFARRTRLGATAGVLAVAVLPLLGAAAAPAGGRTPSQRNLEYLGRALPEDAVVIADQPWAVAWYANRLAVWMPEAAVPVRAEGEELALATAADVTKASSMLALQRAGVEPDALFLSSLLPTYPATERLGRWQLLYELLRRQMEALQAGQAKGTPWTPPGWMLAATLPPNDFLLVRAEGDAPPRTAEAAGTGR
jgi:hypothetical protein